MSQAHLIGVDVGTQGAKSAIFDTAGRCLASAFERSRLLQPSPGAIEEDPERQVAAVCRTIRTCVRQSRIGVGAVAAIGIDGQMAGIIGVGRDGRAVTPYDSWLDRRCAPYIARMQRAAGPEIIARTGGPPSFNHGPKILRWQREFPRVFRQIVAFVQPGGYVAQRLCALPAAAAFIDKTYLHFSGFADNPRGRWDEGLCRRFGVPLEKLPRIVDAHTVVGELAPAMARACGLRAGVPLIAGCGDTAASFLACGATREGMCVDVAGTAAVFASTTSQFRADINGQTLSWGRSAVPGLWHPYAYINGAGMNLEWFRKQLGAGKSLAQLDRLAARLTPDETLPLFIPHLAGRVAPAWPSLRGAWAGLTWNHGVEHLYRAILESVALEYGLYRDALRRLIPDLRLKEMRITGGGAQSALWNGIKADVLGCRVVQLAASEGAPRGVAMLAGFGVGLFKNLDRVAGQWIQTGRVTPPNPGRRAHYTRRLRQYAALLETTHTWSEP